MSLANQNRVVKAKKGDECFMHGVQRVLCPTCEHLGRGRVRDGGGILRDGAHIGLRGAAGWRDSQWCHHHPWFELQKKKKFLHPCVIIYLLSSVWEKWWHHLDIKYVVFMLQMINLG